MYNIREHIVAGDQAHQLVISVTDERGAGGAYHRYEITGFDATTNPSDFDRDEETTEPTKLTILFQNGPINEAGVNGVSQEALLAVILDRLRGFQNGPFPSEETAEAIEGCAKALAALQKRTLARIARGVEGTTQA